MTTKIELLDTWLLCKRGRVSLQIRSFKENTNSQGLKDTGQSLVSELGKLENTDRVIEFLSNEEFYHLSLVFKSPEIIILKSDTVRSVPLFYTFSNNQLYVSDQNNPKNGYVLDEDSIIEMIEIGYVLEDRTVYKSIFGVQAAEIIVFKNGGIQKNRFFKYDVAQARENTNQLSVREHANKVDSILKKIFQEIIDSIPDKGRIIVPLSGGHDSRMIVNYLYKLGCKKVLCYTYGVPGNIQSKISRKVAEALAYEWHFIEYTDEKWEEVHKNGDFDNFIKYAFNGVSNPHLQDFLAVYELKKNGFIKPEDVFIPGHGLDILCFLTEFSNLETDIIDQAVKCFRWSPTKPVDKNKVVYKRYAKIFKKAGISKVSFLDYLFWQEKAAKFTVNSLKVYKFYGYETRIPFWDIRLINFWLDIEIKLKRSRILLKNMEKEGLLTQQIREIPYASDRNLDEERRKNVKDYIPGFLKVLYLRISKKKQPQDEGLNLIYSKKAESVSELIESPDKWPDGILNNIGNDLQRYPFQINHHFLTRLYTINKLLSK